MLNYFDSTYYHGIFEMLIILHKASENMNIIILYVQLYPDKDVNLEQLTIMLFVKIINAFDR